LKHFTTIIQNQSFKSEISIIFYLILVKIDPQKFKYTTSVDKFWCKEKDLMSSGAKKKKGKYYCCDKH